MLRFVRRSTQVSRAQRLTPMVLARSSAVLLLLAATVPAVAASPFEGRFRGRGEGRLTLQVSACNRESGQDRCIVDAATAVPSVCTGEVSGPAQQVGTQMLRLRKVAEGAVAACEVTLRYSPDHGRIEMHAEGCNDFRGTSCDFVGNLKRR